MRPGGRWLKEEAPDPWGSGAAVVRVDQAAGPAEAGRAVVGAGGSGGGLQPEEPRAAALVAVVGDVVRDADVWFSYLWTFDCGSPLVGCHPAADVAGAEVTGPPVQVCQTRVLATFGAAVTTTSSMTGPNAALSPIGVWPIVLVVLVKVSVVEGPVAANEKVSFLYFMSAGRVLRRGRVVGEWGCRVGSSDVHRLRPPDDLRRRVARHGEGHVVRLAFHRLNGLADGAWAEAFRSMLRDPSSAAQTFPRCRRLHRRQSNR